MPDIGWDKLHNIEPRKYTCGHCARQVASDKGYYADTQSWVRIYICPWCGNPTYFGYDNEQIPGVAYGEDVDSLPEDVGALYREARRCMTVSSYTAAVLICRKVLMNVAVDKGAEEDQSFKQYVNYLAEKGYVPPEGKGWVDHIRDRGNDANHEIALMERADAETLIAFLGMLLKIIYEFPRKAPTT